MSRGSVSRLPSATGIRWGRFAPALLAGLLTAPACSGNVSPSAENHTPASAALVVDGTAGGDPILLVAGTAVPVEVKFYDDNGNEITNIEDGHFAKLTFAPATLATVADVPDRHFHKTVTGQAQPGGGTVIIGYGHDTQAAELTFGPYAVSVVAAARE